MQELRASGWLPGSYDVASCMKRQPRWGRGVIAGKELRSSHARGSKHCKRGSHATRKNRFSTPVGDGPGLLLIVSVYLLFTVGVKQADLVFSLGSWPRTGVPPPRNAIGCRRYAMPSVETSPERYCHGVFHSGSATPSPLQYRHLRRGGGSVEQACSKASTDVISEWVREAAVPRMP